MKKDRARVLPVQKIPRSVSRKRGTRVITGGTFDLFHVGHIKFLEKASEKGDVLIVGVTADSLVRKRKGKDRPIMPEAERAYLVSCLRCVDYAFIAREYDWLAAGYLELLKPDVFVIGKEKETAKRNKEMRRALKEHMPKLKLVETERRLGVSTTDIATYLKKSSWKPRVHTIEIKSKQ